MSDRHETIADIIADMRSHGQQNIDAEKDKPEYGILTAEREIALNYADRLEAALRRERGDCATLREALCEILSYIESFHKYITPSKGKKLTALFAVADTIRTKARAALAEPARNCDMGTVKELNVRYTKFCYAHRSHEKGCGGCPLCGEPCCELAWAQLPYVEKEGGAK